MHKLASEINNVFFIKFSDLIYTAYRISPQETRPKRKMLKRREKENDWDQEGGRRQKARQELGTRPSQKQATGGSQGSKKQVITRDSITTERKRLEIPSLPTGEMKRSSMCVRPGAAPCLPIGQRGRRWFQRQVHENHHNTVPGKDAGEGICILGSEMDSPFTTIPLPSDRAFRNASTIPLVAGNVSLWMLWPSAAQAWQPSCSELLLLPATLEPTHR